MKPKQTAPKKSPDMNSAPIKRLLKWITTTVSSTEGVTYTQVKNFMDSTERKAASLYDVKDVLKNFVDDGRLKKVGYKYVLPQSPNTKLVVKKTNDKKQVVKKTADMKQVVKKTTDMKQVVKKTTDKKQVVKKTTDVKQVVKKTIDKKSTANPLKQNIQNYPQVIEVKRSPGIIEGPDTMIAEINPLEGIASNEVIFPPSIDAEMLSQTTDAHIPSQTIDAAEPFQTVDAEEPFQNTAIPAQTSSKAQTEEPVENEGTFPVSAVGTEFNE